MPIYFLMIMFPLTLIIAAVLLLLPLIIAKKTYSTREKLTPYESGFSPATKSRSPFSLRFFMMTILFLIFDVEIVLLIPMISTSFLVSPWLSTKILFAFIIILIVGFAHEWNQGVLSWTN